MNPSEKSVLVIGTGHDFQVVGNPWETLFRDMLASVVNTYDIQIILEEWNDNRGIAIGSTLATDQLHWENVGTQDLPEYNTYVGWINNAYDPQQPTHQYFREYPLDIQEKREQFMVKRIAELMAVYERGLFVVGMNHLHSCMTKLKLAGFDVKGGNWLRIPDTGKHLECPNCHELVDVRVEYDAKVLEAEESTEEDQDTTPTSKASGKSNAPIIPPHPKDCRCISCDMKRGT